MTKRKNETDEEYRARNNARVKTYYAKNKEKVSQRNKERYSNDPEYRAKVKSRYVRQMQDPEAKERARKRSRDWYYANTQQALDAAAANRAKYTREELNARGRYYYQKNIEARRAKHAEDERRRRKENPEKYKAAQDRYKAKHPEKIKARKHINLTPEQKQEKAAYMRQYLLDHPEYVEKKKGYRRKWNETNPDKVFEQSMKQKAKRLQIEALMGSGWTNE